MSSLSIGQKIFSRVDTLAFGGEGIVRQNGLVIFVPFAAAGDEIELEIIDVKKNFARAKLNRVVTPANTRISPKCPHFGVCGGCQLQHLDYPTQLEFKKRWVAESFERIGKIKNIETNHTIGASAQWKYRRVVRLHFRVEGKSLSMGYIDADAHDLMSIRTCPIFSDDEELWKTLKSFLNNLTQGHISKGFFSLFRKSDKVFVALIQTENKVPNQLLERCKSLPPPLSGLVLVSQEQSFSFGDTSLALTELGMTFEYTPLCFVQNHEEQSGKILRSIISETLASGAKKVFDLYCGFGVSAITLAKEGISVVAVENNPESIRLARQNATRNRAQVEWICDDVAHFIEKGLRRHNPELVVVNPPRVGLSPRVCEALAKSQVHTIIYVSCMPQTLARDLAVLYSSGFMAKSCQPYDMFPQTTHVETLIVLQRLRS